MNANEFIKDLSQTFSKFFLELHQKCEQYAAQYKSDEKVGKQKKKKEAKDPNAPKKPASAYILFFKDRRPQYIKEHPETPNQEIVRQIGLEWGQLSQKQQQKYKDMSQDNKLKYDKDFTEYKLLSGNNKETPSKKVKKEMVQLENISSSSSEGSESDQDQEEEEELQQTSSKKLLMMSESSSDEESEPKIKKSKKSKKVESSDDESIKKKSKKNKNK